MGQSITAECECGFKSGPMLTGGGMLTFELFEVFKAFREWAKRHVEARGEELDPGWYPEEHPELWGDDPDLLEAFGLSPKTTPG